MSKFSQIKIEYKTKEDQVYDILRESILECDLKPGEKLVIDQLSQQLNISTIPIRAAIQRLGVEGLAEVKPHSPAKVAEISLEMVKETFALLAALEQVAFEVVAEQADPEKIQILESMVEEMGTAIAEDNLKAWAQKNISFHWQIAELTEMPLLIEYTHRTFDQWRRLSNYYFKSVTSVRIHKAQEEHVKILKHIKNQEIDALISLAKKHNQAAFESYQSLIQEELEKG